MNLRLFLRRNFTAGALSTFLLGFAVYGTVFILPVYLGQVQDYNAQQIGMVLAWTGLPQLLVIPLMPRLMRMVDARWLIAAGFGLFALSNFMNVTISLDVAADQLLLPNIVRAVGRGAGADAAHRALRRRYRARGQGLDLGADQRHAQPGWRHRHRRAADLPDHARVFPFQHAEPIGLAVRRDDAPAHRPAGPHHFLNHGVTDPAVAWHKAVAAIGHRIHHQAYTMAFGDTFLLMGVTMIAALVAALLLKKPQAFSAR